MPLEFEWDEEKRRSNIEKHKLDFVRAHAIFDGRPVIHSDSSRLGEKRSKSTGIIDGVFVTVIWTLREGRIRIISARGTRDEDKRAYHETFG